MPTGKRKYRRTTPIGRAQKNLLKVSKTFDLVQARLISWGAVNADDVDSTKEGKVLNFAFVRLTEAQAKVVEASKALHRLEELGFVPARRSSAVVFDVGGEVKISDKYRGKYLEVYSAVVVDKLVVSKVLTSGEIAVTSGKTTFVVPKSHLARRGAGA